MGIRLASQGGKTRQKKRGGGDKIRVQTSELMPFEFAWSRLEEDGQKIQVDQQSRDLEFIKETG